VFGDNIGDKEKSKKQTTIMTALRLEESLKPRPSILINDKVALSKPLEG
jgi:hypothetical protein